METVKIPNSSVVKTVTRRKTMESKVMVIVSRSEQEQEYNKLSESD